MLTHISCAPGAHIGEAIARDYLLHELSSSQGIILTNYHHPAGNGTEENDLVLINERGVWAIEVKHWFGRIDADSVYWLHNGYRHYSPVISVETKTRSIASAIQQAGFTNVSVVGLVVLTRHESKFGSTPPDEHQRKVFRLTHPLIEAVTGSDYLYRPHNQTLTANTIQKIAHVLVDRKVDPQRRIIGNYRLLRELEPGDTFTVYEAQHVRFEQRRARIKRYEVTGYTSKTERDNALRRFEQDMQALIQLDSPFIVRELDFLTDPDNDNICWLILEWIEGQTLQNRREEEKVFSFAEQVRILYALASALEACHSKGILHRNLTPTSVYLAESGTVQVGDFDFARVPGIAQTISITGKPLITNKYTAPEMRDTFRDADPLVDLYSLGAIWYDMVLSLSEPVIMRENIAHANLPDDARDLLSSLLAQQPNKRPSSAREVREWLDVL